MNIFNCFLLIFFFQKHWFVDRVEIKDPHTSRSILFPCNKWLSKDKEDGEIARDLFPVIEGGGGGNSSRDSSRLRDDSRISPRPNSRRPPQEHDTRRMMDYDDREMDRYGSRGKEREFSFEKNMRNRSERDMMSRDRPYATSLRHD